jgi:hypothetical protein
MVMSQEQYQSLVELASKAGLRIVGLEILFSEWQGTPATDALVRVDRWLAFRDGAIRMQVRVLARESANADFECISEGEYSDPLTAHQARSMVEHWTDLQHDASRRYHARAAAEQARFDAFGPRPESNRHGG